MSEEIKNEGELNFDVSSFNQSFGTQFEDAGSLKSALESANKYGELNTQLESLSQEKDQWSTKYSELENKYNSVLGHFSGDDVIEKLYGSKNTWERVQLEKKFADKDPDVVSKIYKSDINTLADDEVLLLADKLSMKIDLTDAERKEAILESLLGNGVDLSDLNSKEKYKLSRAAADARKQLEEIKSFKPDEPTFDWLNEAKAKQTSFAERQANLKKNWSKVSEDLVSKYDGVKVFDGEGENVTEIFSYKPDDKFKETIKQTAKDLFVQNGLDVNDENLKLFNEYVKQQHIVTNYEKMIKAARASQKTQTEDALHTEIHNDKPKNDMEAPPSNSGKTMTLLEYRQQKYSKK